MTAHPNDAAYRMPVIRQQLAIWSTDVCLCGCLRAHHGPGYPFPVGALGMRGQSGCRECGCTAYKRDREATP